MASKYVTSLENQPRSQPFSSSLRPGSRSPPTSRSTKPSRCSLTQPSRNTPESSHPLPPRRLCPHGMAFPFFSSPSSFSLFCPANALFSFHGLTNVRHGRHRPTPGSPLNPGREWSTGLPASRDPVHPRFYTQPLRLHPEPCDFQSPFFSRSLFPPFCPSFRCNGNYGFLRETLVPLAADWRTWTLSPFCGWRRGDGWDCLMTRYLAFSGGLVELCSSLVLRSFEDI